MTIPENPISPEESSESQESSLIVGDHIPSDDLLVVESENDNASAPAVIESSFTELDEPGEIAAEAAPQKQSKPAYIAILTILGLIALCCIMGGVMFLLLRTEILAGGV